MRRRVRRRSRRGFTIVELIISLALSTVGLLGLLSLEMIAIRANGSSRNITEAMGLAQDRVERAQATIYTSLATLNAVETGLTPAPGSTNQAVYTRTTVVVAGATSSNVTVTVQWADPFLAGAKPHTVTLYTVRTP